jgi:hypothetical protein
MAQRWIEFGTGLLAGGLALSAGWGLFWLVIGVVGYMRGTCSQRVLLNGLAGLTIPLLMLAALAWLWDSSRMPGFWFACGLGVMPLVLVTFGLRRAPDGRRAGVHMLGGVRHLMGTVLGAGHQGCGGCGGEHGRGTGGCG